MLHWIFFTVAGVFLVGSFLRGQTRDKEADAARTKSEPPEEDET